GDDVVDGGAHLLEGLAADLRAEAEAQPDVGGKARRHMERAQGGPVDVDDVQADRPMRGLFGGGDEAFREGGGSCRDDVDGADDPQARPSSEGRPADEPVDLQTEGEALAVL